MSIGQNGIESKNDEKGKKKSHNTSKPEEMVKCVCRGVRGITICTKYTIVNVNS